MEEKNNSQVQISIDDLIRGFGCNGKFGVYYFNVLLNNMNEDQIYKLLDVFIDTIQKTNHISSHLILYQKKITKLVFGYHTLNLYIYQILKNL